MENIKIRRKGRGIKIFCIFLIAISSVYFVGFSDLFCSNCKLRNFATQLPVFKKRKLNSVIDITNETKKYFSERKLDLFKISMIESEVLYYKSEELCKCMIIISETSVSNYELFGVRVYIDLVFLVKQKEIVPFSATLNTVGL